MLIVDVPATEHVGAVVVIVGTAGVGNIVAIENELDGADEQLPFDEVTV